MFDILFDWVLPILGGIVVLSLMADLRAAYSFSTHEFERRALQDVGLGLLITGFMFLLWDIHEGLSRSLIGWLAGAAMLVGIALLFGSALLIRDSGLRLMTQESNKT